MGECAICGKETDRLCECSERGRLVCDSCYVEAIDLCGDCEETWGAEEDLDFPYIHYCQRAHARLLGTSVKNYAPTSVASGESPYPKEVKYSWKIGR